MIQTAYDNNQQQFNLSEISLISNRQPKSISAQQPQSTEASPPPSTFDTLANQFMALEILFRNTEDNIRTDIRSLKNNIRQKELQSVAMEKEIVLVKNQLKERKKDIAVLLSMLKKQETTNKSMTSSTKRSNKSGPKSTSITSKGNKITDKKKSPKRQQVKEKEKQGNKSMRRISPTSQKQIPIGR